MSSANAAMITNLAFGWRANGNADGFEQEHGRFIIEVYWNSKKREWGVYIWGRVSAGGKVEQRIMRETSDPDLTQAKKIGIRIASVLEKEALGVKG